MTMLREPETRHAPAAPTRTGHIIDWFLGVVGFAGVGAGLWLRYGPTDVVPELAEAWPFLMIITGALMLFVTFDRLSRRLMERDDGTHNGVALAALISLGVAIAFALIWLL